ncbi:hypothetical protein Hanom_Chr00s151056g01822031 [Helianthus anomalus]
MCETQAICFTRAGFTLLGVNIDEYQVRYTRGENYFTMNRVKLCRCTTSFFLYFGYNICFRYNKICN